MIKNKKIAIIGFGKEGIAAANYLGSKNEISVFDEKKESQIPKSDLQKAKMVGRFYFNSDIQQDKNFDYIVRSPGVKPDNLLIERLKSPQTVLTSSTEIFFDDSPCEIIGVTGTKGKGTTATLIYEMIKTKYKQVYLAGNIGTPPLEILPKLKKESKIILELSSFQLLNLKKSPHIAVVLMITSEHLDWHQSAQEYKDAKKSIVSYQDKNDFAIINLDFESSKSFAQDSKAKTFYFSTQTKTNGTYLDQGSIISEINSVEVVCKKSDILLPGPHNIQNVLAAVAVAKVEEIENASIQKVLKTFKGLPHRLQLIRDHNGIKFYNDSFSTTPETTLAAIESFAASKILILGGSSKNSDFKELGAKIAKDKSVKGLILIGIEAEKIKKASAGFAGIVKEGCKNMHEIVKAARELAQYGDIVILSPACASFDMFTNYEDRGNQFIKEVSNLK